VLASGSADTALLEILLIADHFSETRAEAPGDSDPPIVQLPTVRRSKKFDNLLRAVRDMADRLERIAKPDPGDTGDLDPSQTAPRQPLAQPPVSFEAPFAAHRFASRRVALRIQQDPNRPRVERAPVPALCWARRRFRSIVQPT